MKYTEQAVETLDDAGSVIANKNIEIEQLRQRVQELEERRCEICGYAEHHREHTGCLRAQLAAVQEECEFQRNAHKQAEELMLEQSNQLAAAQGKNERLRIALGCTKRDLIRMRCPDFFEGVKDGYENLFDGHLVSMIGLINDYAKQK